MQGLIIQPTLWASYLENEFVWNGDTYGVENVGKTRRLGVDFAIRYQPAQWLYLDVEANFANPRTVDSPKGHNYLELAPIFSSTGGVAVILPFGLNASLRYRYMARRPANEDYSIATFPYFVNDLVLAYNRSHWGTQLTIQNLFNVKYNEAMFATETKLKGESESQTDLTITPSSPIYIKLALYYKW